MPFFAEPIRLQHWIAALVSIGALYYCHSVEQQVIPIGNYAIQLNDIFLALYIVAFFVTLFYIRSTKYRLMTIFAVSAIAFCLNGNYISNNHNYFPQTEAMRNAQKHQQHRDSTTAQ